MFYIFCSIGYMDLGLYQHLSNGTYVCTALNVNYISIKLYEIQASVSTVGAISYMTVSIAIHKNHTYASYALHTP